MKDRPGTRPRTPGLFYTAITLVVVLLVGIVSLTHAQPPPPTIAEFAPQAVEQIEDAPDEQTSEFGTGEDGTLGDRTAAPTPRPDDDTGGAPPIDVPRVRRCIGDPPRQIEDPQSPPCVPYWEGDNGGSTSKGVTRDEIRIAVPWIPGSEELSREARALEAFFNRRFEFYGRKLALFRYPGAEAAADNSIDPSQQRADADGVDQEIQPFASTPYSEQNGAEYHYMDALARRQIVSVASGWGLLVGEDHFVRHQPYQWGIQPGSGINAQTIGSFACSQVAGKPARFARGAEADQTRVFGLLVGVNEDGSRPDVAPLEQELARCGAEIETETEIRYGQERSDGATAVLRLRERGVTSVFLFMDAWSILTGVMGAATQQGYFPEWLPTSFANAIEDIPCQSSTAREQCDQMFGIDFQNKILPPDERPIGWAMKEADPGFNGQVDGARNFYLYWPLLLLSSGIQMAGPDLNPETFQHGLFRAQFPNPGCGGPPYFQACVGFGSADHSFFDDAAVKWWNGAQRSRTNNLQGTFCYSQRGTRYRSGTWPTEEIPLFEGACY